MEKEPLKTLVSDYDFLTLLYLFYSEEPQSSTAIARAVYEPKDRDETSAADSTTRSRLMRLEEMDLVILEKKYPRRYSVNRDRVRHCRDKVIVLTVTGETISIDMGEYLAITNVDNCLVVKPVDNVWKDEMS